MKYSKRFEEYKSTFEKSYLSIEKISKLFTPQTIGENVKLLAGINDGRYAIAVMNLNSKIDFELSSTSLIEVEKIYSDKLTEDETLIFSLMDNDLISIFISFAIDMEGVIKNDSEVSIVELYNRYLYWQKMFSHKKEGLPENTIKGLIHELFIIKEFMIPKYGFARSLKGWIGTEKNHKDFAYADGMWYEVKAVNAGKKSVEISSIEQLDSDHLGLIILTEFEKTSENDRYGINLLKIVNELLNTSEIDSDKLEIMSRIILMGIPADELNDANSIVNSYTYIVKETRHYKVDKNFPRISRENLPKAIGDVSYEIIISDIQKYSTEFL